MCTVPVRLQLLSCGPTGQCLAAPGHTYCCRSSASLLKSPGDMLPSGGKARVAHVCMLT